MWTWIIIILVIAIFTALLFNSVYVSVYYRRSEAENDTELIIKYLFFKKKIPIEKKEKSKKVKKPEEEKEDLPTRGLKFYYNLYKLLKDDVFDVLNYLMKKAVVFKEINIKSKIEKIKEEMKTTLDINKKTELANKLMELKKGSVRNERN